MFRIESRWPSWARWRVVTPAPHSERFPYDSKGLCFIAIRDALAAVESMRRCNAGEYRIITDLD